MKLIHKKFLILAMSYTNILLPTSNTPSLCSSLKSKYSSISDNLAYIFKSVRNLIFCLLYPKFRQTWSIKCKTNLPRLGRRVFGLNTLSPLGHTATIWLKKYSTLYLMPPFIISTFKCVHKSCFAIILRLIGYMGNCWPSGKLMDH